MNIVRYEIDQTIQDALEGTDQNFEPTDGRIAGDFRAALQDFRGDALLDVGSDVYVGGRWFNIEGEDVSWKVDP